MDLEAPLLTEAIKGVVIFLGGLLTTWITQKAMRRNARAAAKTAELDAAVRPIQNVNEAWADFVDPLRDELKELRGRIGQLETDQRETRTELTETKGHLERALELVVRFVHWSDQGAPPPPPDVPQWVRAYMVTMINDLHTGETPIVSTADSSEGN